MSWAEIQQKGWERVVSDITSRRRKDTRYLCEFSFHYSPATDDLFSRTVRAIQKALNPEGVILRNPTTRRIERRPLTSAGPNEVWCCDGHDKLSKYGFSMWGMRDKFSRKWLSIWVMPSSANRYAAVAAYLWLSKVLELGGMPIQTSTDCGSETTLIYRIANALR